ncbi:MAG: glycosyltransferase family 4 protein [Syntrophomonas sp.]|nr:glycosyltransferase family 4 protein [Syntrophomonas sp.]MDD2511098.1 glycosyltransferase family 4 protein [Syntrophomonas sp.]MDD3879190.1 glycosyltransferase family 4 protein [Syntrophomonas sp.]MDD4625650.1 glycosyltransferase family 4 protein [Syntrophomonas sp.]
MKVALLSPIAWRTPPRHYGPWERVVSLIAEGLVKKGIDVTLFATGDSKTSGHLEYVCPIPYEENPNMDPKVWEAMHIAHLFEQAHKFDFIHNNYDFLPLSYSRLVDTPMITTIHGFSSPKILPIYREYNRDNCYVSISNADRSPDLDYVGTVYHGIDLNELTLNLNAGSYLLYFGRIHPDKGTAQAIEIARKSDMQLLIAGIIQDKQYFNQQIYPRIDNKKIIYLGSVGPARRDELLGNALALLHPIHFNEPFGLSVIEAMACGTPVIAFNKGSMPEVIKDGETGFLVDNVEMACEKLQCIHSIKRANCRYWVEKNFSQERMVSDYLSLYQEIIKGGKFSVRTPSLSGRCK